MYNFILQVIMILSLGAVVFIATRALPRLTDVTGDKPRRANLFDRAIIRRIPLDKLDTRAHFFMEKFLRKVKLLIMKTDNYVDDRIVRLKKSKNGKTQEDIKEHIEVIVSEKEDIQSDEETSQNGEKTL